MIAQLVKNIKTKLMAAIIFRVLTLKFTFFMYRECESAHSVQKSFASKKGGKRIKYIINREEHKI